MAKQIKKTASRGKRIRRRVKRVVPTSIALKPRIKSPNVAKEDRSPANIRMSMCAQKYAVALMQPFALEAQGACIPTAPAVPSFKSRTYIRGDGVIGTAGVGVLACMFSTVNDAPTAYVSNATFAGTTVPAFAVASGLDLIYNNSTFTYGNYTNPQDLQSRIVAAGVNFQYTGTTLNESGLVYGLHSPDHINLNGLSGANLGARSETVIQRVSDRTTLQVNGYPTTAIECAYDSPLAISLANLRYRIYPWTKELLGVFPANGTYPGGTAGAPLTVFLITGVAGASFHYELVQLNEFTGRLAQPHLSPSHSDTRGMEMVVQSAQHVAFSVASEPDCPPICAFKKLLIETAQDMAPKALDVLLGPVASSALKLAATAVRRLF
jgi:hypothetical protein